MRSLDTLSIPTRNIDIWGSTDHDTAQILQNSALEKKVPSRVCESAASITGNVATQIMKSLNVMICVFSGVE